MNHRIVKATLLGSVALWCSSSWSSPREGMTINRQVILSPAHKVAPYTITRASNGDFIVAGADNVGDYRAWAMRVTKSGEPIWEYLDGPADGWTDYSQNNQRFYSAVDLSDGNTLLCGIKRVEKKIAAFLVRLGPDGKLIDERILRPAHDGFAAGGITCVALDDGVAVLAGLASVPRGTGWLSMLDASGNVLWEKFGDQFGNLDAMPTQAGGLFIIGSNEVLKIDGQGNVLARHSLPGSDQHIVHSVGHPTRVRIAAMLSTLKTVILDFDLDLQGLLHTTHVENIGLRRCFESGEGSVTLFGSRYFNQPTAGVARVYKDGDYKGFTLEPHFQSGWFYDAVPVDPSTREFATVRDDDTGRGLITWISFK
jgi:hypothetical protein